MWDNGAAPVDLNTRLTASNGWTIVDAYHVNEYGEILVRATKGTTNQYLILTMSGLSKCRSCLTPPPPTTTTFSGSISGSSTDKVLGTAIDGVGDVYVLGTAGSSNTDLDPRPSATSYASGPQIFLSKISKLDGRLVWTKKVLSNTYNYTTEGQDVKVDTNGNVFVLGRQKPDSYWSNLILERYATTDGTQKYTGVFQGKDWADIRYGTMAVDAQNNLYVGLNYGNFSSDIIDMDPNSGTSLVKGNGLVIAKLSTSQTLLKTYAIQASSQYNGAVEVPALTASPDGSLWIAGGATATKTIDFDPTAGTDTVTMSAWQNYLVKIKPDGSYGGKSFFAEYSFQPALISDSSNNVYLLTTNGSSQVLRKFNSSATLAWARTMVGYGQGSLQVDAGGNIFVSGQGDNYSGLDYNPDPVAVDFQRGGLFVTKVKSDGSYVYTRALIGDYTTNYKGNNGKYPVACTKDSFGNIALSGTYYGTAENLPSGSSYDVSLYFMTENVSAK